MSASPRVLAVSVRYPPYVGGGYELLTRDAVEGLRSRGALVTVLTARGERLAAEAQVLAWLEPSLDAARDLFEASFDASNRERFRLHFLRLANYRSTLRAIDAVQPDVLLYFNLAHLSLAPLLAARHAGLPVLGYAADRWPSNHWVLSWRDAAAAGRAAKEGRLHALEQAWRTLRDHVGFGRLLACSAHLREELLADGLLPESVGVLWPPLSPELADGGEPRARNPEDPLRVVCASALWDGKGQHVLLKAAGRARANGAPVEIVLAGGGDGEYARYLHELAREPELAGAVRFLGQLPRAELARHLGAAHVLATPSLWPEPFGMVTIEAMAQGLAVLGSDAGATPEILSGGGGIVLPAGDPEPWCHALLELAADDARRIELARTARARAAAEFSLARFLDGLEAELARARGSTA